VNAENTHKILGPPGCGKTTDLLKRVDLLLNEGYSPREICFITFTRKAAGEAKSRAMAKFKMQEGDLPWFRTIHSLVFQRLGLSRSMMMGKGDYCNLCEVLGIYITFKGVSEDGTIAGFSKGDRLFFMENMARARMMDLRKYWEDSPPDEGIYWYELDRLSKTLRAYKEKNDKRDFTDMLEIFVKGDHEGPPVKVLIVDEAQDLSKLQWEVVNRLAKNVEEVYVAGDDDQAIFRWAGADVDTFINLPGDSRVLPQSYRVPIRVQALAEEIRGRIQVRMKKDWLPTEELGEVIHVGDMRMDMSKGTWLLLARNVYLLEEYCSYCLQNGYIFDAVNSPIRGGAVRAIKAWEELRRGKSVTIADVRCVYDLMSVKKGVRHGSKSMVEKINDQETVDMARLRRDLGLITTEIWHVALDKITALEREYFIAALRRGEKLLREPRIKVSTIHGAKGGEADHVVLQLDMAERTYREYEVSPDDEMRVWYVACTRAKKTLTIIAPRTGQFFEPLA